MIPALIVMAKLGAVAFVTCPLPVTMTHHVRTAPNYPVNEPVYDRDWWLRMAGPVVNYGFELWWKEGFNGYFH